MVEKMNLLNVDMRIKLDKLRIWKRSRSRVRQEEQIHKDKKKYNRKCTNPKIDPHRFLEGTVNDDEQI